jgi:hypothetical protein
VRRQLARCVRVEPRERDHRPAADPPGQVLERRGVRAAPLELLAHQALVLARLFEVLAKRRGQLLVAGDVRRPLHLRERLYFDRVHVGQVLGQLVVERAGGHVSS